MIAELLFIGTELLLGQILNTNAQYLSQRLAAIGVDVYRQTVVGDNFGRVEACVSEALGRSDILITSGGLGPTADDLTREAVARALGLPLVTDSQTLHSIERFFAERSRPMTPNNAKQALLPAGGQMIPNPRGTAPGVYVEHHGKKIAMLPGPPHELVPMFEQAIVPRLTAGCQAQTIVSRVLHLCGIGESDLETRVRDLIDAQGETTIAPLASLGEVKLRLTTKADSQELALRRMAPIEEEIRRRLGRHVYGMDGETLAQATAALLIRSGFRLGLAESCTGGMLAAELTGQPGISAAFPGGVVAYADATKSALLGVPKGLLRRHGAVSAQVCGAMARGIQARLGADFGLAITGIAGPEGGTPAKPVGLVYIGLAASSPDELVIQQHRFLGDRSMVRARAVRQALVMLRESLLDRTGVTSKEPAS